MSQDYECQTFPIFPLVQPVRAPSIFHGEAGEDPSRWLKEYERITKFNRWDDTMCLSNAYFFLKGTTRLWYENNEENLISLEKFREQLKIVFGSTQLFIKQAERELKNRVQKTGENIQSYIQSVLTHWEGGSSKDVSTSAAEYPLESPSLDEVIREEVQQALCPVISSSSAAVNRRNEPPRRPRTYATVVRQQEALSNFYLSLGSPMWGEPTITDLFAFIVGDQATWFVTFMNDELFSMCTEAAKQLTVSHHPLSSPLTNTAGKRLEHHHLFQAGEDHQYANIDHPLPMADVVSVDLPSAETRKTK
ncbi:CCHC-type domain-containing protein [Trichonephila clavipes]|nr:CCHC-type domain-containing protein [Trichonephila clavipes]